MILLLKHICRSRRQCNMSHIHDAYNLLSFLFSWQFAWSSIQQGSTMFEILTLISVLTIHTCFLYGRVPSYSDDSAISVIQDAQAHTDENAESQTWDMSMHFIPQCLSSNTLFCICMHISINKIIVESNENTSTKVLF